MDYMNITNMAVIPLLVPSLTSFFYFTLLVAFRVAMLLISRHSSGQDHGGKHGRLEKLNC